MMAMPKHVLCAYDQALCHSVYGSCAGMQRQGLTAKEACNNFWIADYRGLITSEREDLTDTVAPFARSPGAGDTDGEALADVVRRVREAGAAAAAPVLSKFKADNKCIRSDLPQLMLQRSDDCLLQWRAGQADSAHRALRRWSAVHPGDSDGAPCWCDCNDRSCAGVDWCTLACQTCQQYEGQTCIACRKWGRTTSGQSFSR